MNKKLRKSWEILCKIHILTKHYTLIAEEYNISTKSFLQPMKEQKDAYEHLIRAYTKQCEKKTLSSTDTAYMIKNIEKAIGHEYRAFFDTIDYLTICIRELISTELKGLEYKDIVDVYPEYDACKKVLVELPEEIAEFREKKDIGSDNMLQFASDYGKTLEKLLGCYKIIATDVVKNIKKKK